MRSFKAFFFMVAVLALTAMPKVALASGPGFQGEKFSKVFYFSGPLGKGSKSGLSVGNAKAIADGNIMAINAGTVITKVYVIVDTAVTGSTAVDLGDDDDPDGFTPTAQITLATPGMYGYVSTGAYLTSGAAKYYRVDTKTIKLDNTTTNTAGAFRVVVEGYRVGA